MHQEKVYWYFLFVHCNSTIIMDGNPTVCSIQLPIIQVTVLNPIPVQCMLEQGNRALENNGNDTPNAGCF